jgi:molybdopterin/thiamine biosynthesis adenylyltransferase
VRLDEKKGALDTVTPTFHIERNGELCLYESHVAEADGGWCEPQRFLGWVQGWLEKTGRGWPDDTDTDLDRYLEPVGRMVVYDSDDIGNRVGLVRIAHQGDLVRVRWERPFPSRRNHNNQARRRIEKAERRCALVDADELAAPIRSWRDLMAAIGNSAHLVERLHRLNGLGMVLVRYKRNGEPGLLALELRSSRSAEGGVALRAYEGADESAASRTLRSGRKSNLLSKNRVAIVGCGAIGSFTADSLFRSGVRQLTIYDWQRLRPGNVIRHLAGQLEIGKMKVEAVLAELAKIGLPVDHVELRYRAVNTMDDALALFQTHSVVVDATGNDRTTLLLEAAAGRCSGTLVSVCLQREGGIARVDRWPLEPGETRLDPVPELHRQAPTVRERGCGDVVSLTPPYSVQAAASLAARAVIGFLAGEAVPPSAIEVLQAQPDPPYDHAGPLAA